MCPGLPMRWWSQTLRCSGQPRPAMAIAAKNRPTSTQNRAKIDPKSTQIGQKSSLGGSRGAFGLQCGSGSRLDPENQPTWPPGAPQVGSQNRPKVVKKSIQNSTNFSIIFWLILEPSWGRFSQILGSKMEPKLVQNRSQERSWRKCENVKKTIGFCMVFEDPRCSESIKNCSQDDVRLRCKNSTRNYLKKWSA